MIIFRKGILNLNGQIHEWKLVDFLKKKLNSTDLTWFGTSLKLTQSWPIFLELPFTSKKILKLKTSILDSKGHQLSFFNIPSVFIFPLSYSIFYLDFSYLVQNPLPKNKMYWVSTKVMRNFIWIHFLDFFLSCIGFL